MRKFRKPHRVKRKKSILKNRFFWISILILVVLGAVFYFFIFSSFFQVKEIIVSGNEKVPKAKIKSKIEEHLKKKILFFPTKSIFLANLSKIKEDLLNNFPKIADIEIGRGFPNVINTMVAERIPAAVFCQNESYFLLDKEGVIFEMIQGESDLVKIKKGEKIDELVLGEKIVEKDYLEKIFRIQNNISEEFEFEIKEFIILSDRLTIETTEDWQIYFDLKGDLNWQLTKLQLVLKEKIPLQRRKDLEYIELRFGDLAPFKYR